MPYIKPAELLNQIKKNKLGNFYIFAGEESFTIEKGIRLLSKALNIDEMNTEVFYGGDLDISSLILSLQTMPFLSDKKIILLKEAEKIKSQELKKLAEVLKRE